MFYVLCSYDVLSLFLTPNVICHQRSFFQSDETWMLVNISTLQPSAHQQKCKVKTAVLHFEQHKTDVELFCRGLESTPASMCNIIKVEVFCPHWARC